MKASTVNLTRISTYPILIELRDRIKHTNALEFQSFDDIVELRDLLTEHLKQVHNPYIFDPKASTAKFVPPRKLAEGKENIMGDVDTPNAEFSFSALDYLGDSELAKGYCTMRNADYAELNSSMQWNRGPVTNTMHCRIYGLSIVKDLTRDTLHSFDCWGEVQLPDGEVVAVRIKHQIMAYILATYW